MGSSPIGRGTTGVGGPSNPSALHREVPFKKAAGSESRADGEAMNALGRADLAGLTSRSSEACAMDELVALVSQKTGLSPEQARAATETVLGFIKSKLPPSLAGQLDSLVAGSGAGSGAGFGGIADIAKGVGGLFGKS
jgi:hypothetical protein